ncbi:ribonuclease R [Lacticaseibacillus pabuli]|uniref:Ribonuclease R n=1 Tax=Lacticaseibacillus pabuli TaxID=3025672 RepID=A0ABY7WQL2_9LACO|nr:ribonuclease R [Lacticaseibacillus sp. KACC 23028]WDF81956.1 ribonuclease R [Lacticaseibacillus sp. KACC 23028]
MTTIGHMRNELLSLLRRNKNVNYSATSMSRAMKLEKSDYGVLIDALEALEKDRFIHKDKDGLYALGAPDAAAVEGTFRANDKGFGFVAVNDSTDPDVFIAPPNTHFALDGDTVDIKILHPMKPGDTRGADGEVLKIIEHKYSSIVGEYKPLSDREAIQTGFIGTVTSNAKKMGKYEIFIKDTGMLPQAGDMVMTEVTRFPDQQHPETMEGMLVKDLGNKNDPGVDIMSIVAQNHIKADFPQDVLDYANEIPDHVTDKDRQGRRDITDEPVVTIDGDDSKDFDDAVSVKVLPNGNWRLGVHIADVSYYVTPGSPLDDEAYDRGTSTYLTDRVIPMLPFRLSNGICSLNPDEDRLAMSCVMEIDHQGHIVNHEIFQSVIRSHGRLTYNNVNKALEGDASALGEHEDLLPMLQEMAQLHEVLYKMRRARGAIDFDDNEAQIIVDDNGHPIDIVLRVRGTSERMIESMMLAANETVAKHYYDMKVPFLYRVHETPDADSIHDFVEFLATFGIHIQQEKGKDVTPRMLQQVVSDVAGTPEEAMVNVKLLRSLKQARYSPDPLGHFGLAAKYYSHFTSPIRRYPDLVAHRLIRTYATQGTGDEVKEKWRNALPDIAVSTSAAERRSIDAERSVDDLKKAEFMEDKVGQDFDAVVSSVLGFGMFVQLPNTVEGLVHISTMTDDYYQFVEKQMALVGGRTHKMYRIGQAIRVHLDQVDVEQHQVDFSIIDPDAAPTANFDTSDLKKEAPVKPMRRGGNFNGPRRNGNGPRGGNNKQQHGSFEDLAKKWGNKGGSKRNEPRANRGPRRSQHK